jgi:hypothetical protein
VGLLDLLSGEGALVKPIMDVCRVLETAPRRAVSLLLNNSIRVVADRGLALHVQIIAQRVFRWICSPGPCQLVVDAPIPVEVSLRGRVHKLLAVGATLPSRHSVRGDVASDILPAQAVGHAQEAVGEIRVQDVVLGRRRKLVLEMWLPLLICGGLWIQQ